MYAYYEYCDPVTAGWVDRWDQLTPYLTIDILLQVSLYLTGNAHLVPNRWPPATLRFIMNSSNTSILFILYSPCTQVGRFFRNSGLSGKN